MTNSVTDSELPHCLGPPRAVAGRLITCTDAKIEHESGDVIGKLEIDFAFAPNPGLTWQFCVRGDEPVSSQSSVNPGDLVWTSISTDRRFPLRVVIRNISFGGQWDRPDLSGIVDLSSLSASSGEAVEEVRFDVINLNAPYGTAAVTDDSGTRSARHEWECDGWRVILDGQPTADWRRLATTAGYAVTHVGSVTRIDGSPFEFADACEFLECMHWFLSLVQSRRVGIALPRGYSNLADADSGINPIVDTCSVFVTDAAENDAWSWYPSRNPRLGADNLEDLLEAWHAKWSTGSEERWRLKFLVSILCTAATQVILVEPRLVMAFVGLEVFAGESVPSGKQVNMKRDLTVALADHGIPTSADYLKNTRGMEPVTHLIAVRNAIVHRNEQLRDNQWDQSAHIRHAWKVALWMLQQFLLRHFEYGGSYYNHMNSEFEQIHLLTN